MIRDDLAEALRAALAALGVDAPETVHLERPARRDHGDWSSNVALVTAKKVGRAPRDLATDIAKVLTDDPPPHVASVEVAGPGFVNFRLHDSWLHDVLRDVVESGEERYARSDEGGGTKVNIEFVSTNPTGPVHAGGGRWAAYGDSLARILERCGYAPHREFYLNDRGVQMQLFAESLAARKAGRDVPENGYQGEYVVEWAAEMPDDADPLEWGYERVKRDVADTLGRMGVEFDTWFSERSMVSSGAIDATLDELRARGFAYDADGAVWLRTTEFGDDKDRVIVKSDGEPTYALPDIAYHRDKFSRGFKLLIDVWGSDHHGYMQRLKAGVQALGHDPDELEIILGQFVTLVRDGEEVRLSKRAGNVVTIGEVLDEVGPDAARLTFLLQSIDTKQVFDIDLVRSQAMENPVFYVQMAHARLAGIRRFASESGIERSPLDAVDLGLLTHERELEILRSLSELPDAVGIACADRAPHRVTMWVRELAGNVHGFHHDNRVVSADIPLELTQARLWLVEAARIGLAIGMGLLGVSAPEIM
ncbi:MAG: arginine--tRNA ligase [Acidimicrobiales bacterium]|nr:arginine--tRNA ligase [Acidimicrobiales bacterium]